MTSHDSDWADVGMLHLLDDTASFKDVPPAVLQSHLLPLVDVNSLGAFSATCRRLRQASLQEFKERWHTVSARGWEGDDALIWYMRQVALLERSKCTSCKAVAPHKRQHPLLKSHYLCNDCWYLPEFKLITQENAVRAFGLSKTDLKGLRMVKDDATGRGKVRRDRLHVWLLLTDVEKMAERLFGVQWKERADFARAEVEWQQVQGRNSQNMSS